MSDSSSPPSGPAAPFTSRSSRVPSSSLSRTSSGGSHRTRDRRLVPEASSPTSTIVSARTLPIGQLLPDPAGYLAGAVVGDERRELDRELTAAGSRIAVHHRQIGVHERREVGLVD